MKKETTKQVTPPQLRNPLGIGGFGFHPENRNPGRWSKDTSVSYWLNFFLRLSVADFRDWEVKVPEKDRSVAQSVAYARIFAARASLKETEYVTNRTEGYPTQPIETSDADNLDNLSEKELLDRIQEIDKKLKEPIKRKSLDNSNQASDI